MADPIYAQQIKLEELIDVLKDARQALLNAGESAESTSQLLELLGDAADGLLDVVPSVEQLGKAIENIKQGIGSVLDLGPSVGHVRGIAEAVRGWQLFSETVGAIDTDATKQLGDELKALTDVDLEDLSVELEKITKVKPSVEGLKEFANLISKIDSVTALSSPQLEELDALNDAIRQIDLGWTKASDSLDSLSKTDLSKLAEEYKKLSETDLSSREIENLLNVSERAQKSNDIKLSTLITALENIRKSGEIQIELPKLDPESLAQVEEVIVELQGSIANLSDADVSKISEEFLRISNTDFQVEDIKAFVQNLKELAEQNPKLIETGGTMERLYNVLQSLRESGELPRSMKELGDSLQKLSDVDLSRIAVEFGDIKGGDVDFPVENIRSVADSLSEFKVDPKSVENIKVLGEAFDIITDSSKLTTEELRIIGKQINDLADVNLERVAKEYEKITGIKFPLDDLRTFSELIKDLESRKVVSEDDIANIKALGDAFLTVRNEQALPFEVLATGINQDALTTDALSGYIGELGKFDDQLSTTAHALSNLDLELQLLSETLEDANFPEDKIEAIVDHFRDLGKIEKPLQLFEELSELGLPDEEVKRFSESFVTLRKNSEKIVELRENLKKVGVEKDSIEELVSSFIHLGSVLEKLSVNYRKAKTGAEGLTVSSRDLEGLGITLSFDIDEATRSLINFKEEAQNVVAPIDRLRNVLTSQGLEEPARENIVKEIFPSGEDSGITGFSGKLRITEAEEGLTSLAGAAQLGEDAVRNFTVVYDQFGNVFDSVAQALEKNPLEAFIEDLQSLEVPEEAINTISGETFGEGKGLSGVRIKEVNEDLSQLTGTIKAANGAQKAYVVYFNQMGEVMKKAPIEEVKVSLQDFTEQLSGRVGAIGNVNKMLERYGFNISQLKKMTTEASTGITRLEFAMESQGGATQKLTLHVTEFGKVLTDTQRRFRTFASGIARNVGESFKWAVAITAVYGPLRKLQDLVQLSIDNESKLADIGIVLGKSTAELQDIFEDASKAAVATGEGLNGVIEGYSLAYRATGNIADQAERAAVSNQLLVDSLVLSKLSTLDQAEAMDTLVAALLQTGRKLDEGGELLNKWVAVSKAANVSVDTLASSYAIMATAADGVGLEMDELNAIVAVVAANTELSATQAGNAVRAFVSGFQTDTAVEELSKYGIAVTDLEGNTKDFMSVMYEIQSLFNAGLISEAELNKLGTALGGRGARRGAQFTTFLKSLDEVQGLVTVSAEAQADAYDALGIKMDTVQTAITNLSTKFQVLANAVGTEGGVLDLLKLLLEVLDQITESATSFVGVMGKAAPFLAAAGGLYAYGRSTGRVQQMPTDFGNFVTRQLSMTAFGQQQAGAYSTRGALGIQGVAQQASGTGQTIAESWGRRARQHAPVLGLLMAQGTLAAFNIADKDWDGLGGQIGGGIAGFLISGGNPIGAIIGSTIGEALVNAVTTRSGDFESLFRDIFVDISDKESGGRKPDESRQEYVERRRGEVTDELVALTGGESVANVSNFFRKLTNWYDTTFGGGTQRIEGLDTVAGAKLQAQELIRLFETRGPQALSGPTSFTPLGIEEAGGLGVAGFIGLSEEEVEERINALRELLAKLPELKEVQDSLAEGEEPKGTPFFEELDETAQKYEDTLREITGGIQRQLRDEFVEGELNAKGYTEGLERISGSGSSILQVFTALKPLIGDNEESLAQLAEILSRTAQQEIDDITILKDTVADLTNELEAANEAGDINLSIQKTEELKIARFELNALVEQIRQVQREGVIQIALDAPQIVDFAPDEYDLVREEALRILQERIQEYVRLGLIPDDVTLQEVIDSGTKIGIAFGEAFGAAMRGEVDVLASLFDEATENLRLDEAIAPARPEPSSFRIQEVDMTQSAFVAAYEKQLAFLKEAFGAYWQPSLETMGIIFSDGVDVLHLDNLAMQLAMNDLIDVNQKQLEGVYNLPTDSSFYVPFQGYELGFGEGGGAGGLSGAGTELSGSANDLSRAADELTGAAQALSLEEGIEDTPFRRLEDDRQRFGKPIALIGGEKYEEEYKFIGRPRALIGGEKYEEEYSSRPDYGDALIGGEKNLQDYSESQELSTDKFSLSVDEFGNHVQDLSTLGFGGDLEKEFEALSGRIIAGGSSAPPPRTSSILPGAEQPTNIITILQQFAGDLIQGSIDFWRNQFSDFTGIGGGAGIGPEFSFNKLDSAADKLSNFADIMKPAYDYQTLGPPQQIGSSDVATEFSGVLDLLNQKISNLSGFTTNLKISSNYTANLIVDGRTLAQVIKPYLYSDMIRYEDTAASVTKSIVV
jgi:TP901 family phage tail tape measure protein